MDLYLITHFIKSDILTNSMAYGTRRFNAAFTRALVIKIPFKIVFWVMIIYR